MGYPKTISHLCIAAVFGSCCAHRWGVSLLQTHTSGSTAASKAGAQPSCAVLDNHGTHFTVDVSVGTPPQTFSVVADTGSNHLIVPSCTCMDSDRCEKTDRCFRGTNRSSTFSISGLDSSGGPPGMMITFGSGTISAIIATDTARVGGVHATMNQSLLLMVDQALRMSGPFEGILGLGLPQEPQNLSLQAERQPDEYGSGEDPFAIGQGGGGKWRKIIDQIIAGLGGGGDGINSIAGSNLPTANSAVQDHAQQSVLQSLQSRFPFWAPKSREQPTEEPKPAAALAEPKGFLEQAGISRFSMCFKDGGNGTLQLGTPEVADQLGSIGHYHWGLDFRGISMGSSRVPICSRENMTDGQESACAVIPDSGTTAIMAPKAQLAVLTDHICDNWARCRDNFTALEEAKTAAHKAVVEKYGIDIFGIKNVKLSKSDILQLVLQDCGSWLTDSNGLNDELPTLSFEVAGKGGAVTNLDLTAWAYVMEQRQEITTKVYKDFGPLGKVAVGFNRTGKFEQLCSLGFSEMEYDTTLNGPVWILGTPLFYQYKVAYDMNRTWPAMSFVSTETEPCTKCDTALIERDVEVQRTNGARRPRKVQGPWRVPNLDLKQPL